MFPIRDHNPSSKLPYVTYALIAINVAVFLLYFWKPQREIFEFFDVWALFPNRISAGYDYHGLITAMFLHGGVMHIGGNMLFLYIFGDNLEDYFGHVGFLLFYLASGLAASALQIFANPLSEIPNVGASGAIAGVMGGYLLLFPKAKVDVLVILGFFVQIFALPAFVMLGIWFAMQIFGGFSTIGQDGGGVAYWAHAGGFVAGVALVGAAWLSGRNPKRIDGHPDNPPTKTGTRVPIVPRRR